MTSTSAQQSACLSMEDIWIVGGGDSMTPPSSPPLMDDDFYATVINAFHQQRSYSDTSATLAQSVRSLKRTRNSGQEEHDESSTLVDEINDKYESEQGLFLTTASVYIKPIPSPTKLLPGKRSASGGLELLVLNHKNIGLAGDLSELAPLVCNITELDLADNRISSWKEVTQILNHMPLLIHCNLSQNPLSGRAPIEWNCATSRPTFLRLNSLVLNGTSVRWDSLFLLLKLMPNLEELHLSLNNYGTPSRLPPRTYIGQEELFNSVHILHVNKCSLYGWEAIMRICRLFPCLESLVAAQNPISSLSESPDDFKELFGCLHSLNLNHSKLADWDQIDLIRYFPLLCELRLNQVTILENCSDEERWHLLIARLPEVTALNGSKVGPEQRLDAERFFLRHYSNIESKPKRFYELLQTHGHIEPLANVDLKPKMMARVAIVFEENDKHENHIVSLDQNVGHFKKVLQSFCGMPPSKFRVFYVDKEAVGIIGMEELKYPRQMLYTLNVEDGDEFRIQTKIEIKPRRRTSSSTSDTKTKSGAPSTSNG